MSTKTPVYGFTKPDQTEFYDISVPNGNWDIADAQIKALNDGTTAAQILTKLKTVDGAGSQLDADMLDGKQATDFLARSEFTAANDFILGTGNGVAVKKTLAETKSILGISNVTNESKTTMFTNPALIGIPTVPTAAVGTNTTQAASTAFVQSLGGLKLDKTTYTAEDILNKIRTVDGSGSQLDADMLDGKQATDFLARSEFTAANDFIVGTGNGVAAKKTLAEAKSILGISNVTNESKATMFTNPALTGIPTVPTAAVGTNTTQAASTAFVQTLGNLKVDKTNYTAQDVLNKMLTVDGKGSGLDADLWRGRTLYKNVSELGLSATPTLGEICAAMPDNSEAELSFDANPHMPANYVVVKVFQPYNSLDVRYATATTFYPVENAGRQWSGYYRRCEGIAGWHEVPTGHYDIVNDGNLAYDASKLYYVPSNGVNTPGTSNEWFVTAQRHLNGNVHQVWRSFNVNHVEEWHREYVGGVGWSLFRRVVMNSTVITTITSGFATEWSGAISLLENHIGLLEFTIDVTKSSKLNVNGETIYTLPLGKRPINTVMLTVNLFNGGGSSIANSLVNVLVYSDGRVSVYPISGTALPNEGRIFNAKVTYYIA